MSRLSSSSVNENGLILCGYQKKLKTMKKKYFVLYKDTKCNTARLEYYDNERKFKSGHGPKRVIKIKHCFNINRRLDTKHNYVIVLSSKDGGFGIVCETEADMLKWLEALLALQRSNDVNMSFQPNFDHVWQVIVQKKGLAEQNCLIGNYHICLNRKSITFIRIGLEKTSSGETRMSTIEFLLTTIRRCGDSQCFFYMEVGRQSIIGPGELWMETDDTLVAQNMHKLILSAMSAKRDPIIEPMRKRSSSANEASKPVNMIPKRQNQEENNANSPMTTKYFGRERCDSLPTRNRTTSECSNHSFSTLPLRSSASSNLRSHIFPYDNSSPVNSRMICSESEESSISYDELDDNGSFHPYRFNPRSDGVIPEENQDDLLNHDGKYGDLINNTDDVNTASTENYLSMTPGSTAHKYQVDMPENAADQFSCDYQNEIDNHCELPIRAYSIGSRDEHNKCSKRIGAFNDVDQSTRVRAFSVGSRAKIPRCELQRGVLFPRTKAQQTFNSNNNISSTDVTIHNAISYANPCCEKKSNSAPILIHKSLNSVNIMSDLMELDFSKSNNTANKLLRQVEKNSFNKMLSTNTASKDHFKNVKKMSSCEIGPANTAAQNGYLEMKPVCATVGYKSSTDGKDAKNMSATDLSDVKKMQDLHNKLIISKPQNTIFTTQTNTPKPIDITLQRNEENNLHKKNANVKPMLQSMEKIENDIPKESTMKNMTSKLRELSLTNQDMDEYINVDSSTIYKDATSPNVQKSEGVVTCLDATVDVHNTLQSTTPKQDSANNQQSSISDAKTPGSVTATAIAKPAPSSTSNNPKQNTANVINVNLSSRPQSQLLCSAENELHYASLDLPQSSSSDINTKQKILEIYDRNATNTTNTYAKIDFEHSDSTSLKNLNI